jgi:hypothetical protein
LFENADLPAGKAALDEQREQKPGGTGADDIDLH